MALSWSSKIRGDHGDDRVVGGGNALPSMSYEKADMPRPKLTADIITAAIEGFDFQKRWIDEQIAELRAMLPGRERLQR